VSTSGDATVRGNRTGDTPRIGQGDAPAAKPNAGQSTFIAAASAGGETGEDAESADFVSRVKPETGDQRNTSAGTTNPAVARQSADLAQRLGLNQLPNQVSVTVETASANGPASLNLAPNAVLADPGTSDDGAPAFTTSQGKSGSAHVAPDRQDIGSGSQPPTADTLGQTLPQSGPTGSGQTAGGAQLAAVAAQTSAATASVVGAKALPAAVEPAPIGGTSSLNGPGQLTETAKPTPAQPPRQPVPTRTAAEQIAVQIQKGFGGGADKISIRLHPAQLGRVDVKLEVSKDGHLVAAITADKPETLEMLQRDARILERALQDAGLQTNSDSLSFMLRGENANQALPEDRGAGGPLAQGDETDPSNQADDDLAAGGTVHGRNMASDGHIDITV
jgi:flagellar hook-length control protein FliK